MAKIPDNIVSIMMVDNAGAVVSVPVSDFISATTTTVVSAPVVIPSGKQPKAEVINTTIETSVAIEADPNYLTMANATQDNLINSVAYQNANKIGLNTKSPSYLLDVKGDSINIGSSSLPNGYRINSLLVASASSTLKTIYLGDATKLNIINLFSLIIAGLIPASPTTKTRILGIGDTGLVTTFTMPVTGSVLFSDGTTLASDPAHFFWNDTNNRLGILTNTPAYSLDVNGTVRASTSLITPVIGNAAGITANNTWTFTSNVNVPVTPVDATHAASKQYVDDTVLTGLRLGASIKTVATSNIGLSGLSAVNGYTPIAGDRILVIGQTNATQNGVYDAASGGWTRSTDSDTDAELRGYQYLITAGTYINARYGNTNQSAITIGTTNITYQQISNAEIDPIFTASPSFGITNTNITNWNTAYDRSPITLAVSGTTTKTITLTKQNGTTLTASFTDTVTSVFGRTGDVVLLSSDVTNALGYTPYNGTDGSIRNLFSATAPLSYSNGLYSISQATTSSNGYLSSTDWNIFNGKESVLTFTAPLVRTTNAISITQATTSTNGYLSSADWTTFNSKQATITLSTPLITSGSVQATFNSATGALSIPYYANVVTSIVAGTGITISSGTGAVTINSTAGSVPSLAQVCAVGSDATGFVITANAFFESSDIRLKTVLGENPNIDLSKLDVIKYLRTTHDKDKIRYGYSAQEVHDLCPELVNTDSEGYLSVNYTDTHTLLILSLQKRIAELERKLNAN
jgi:hypothetical protein